MTQSSNVESVLLNEVDNQNGVFLYLEGNTWCAYERSAYYLAMHFPVTIVKEIIYEGYDVILLKATFSTNEMRLPLFRSAILQSVADDKLLFRLDQPVEGFTEWKAEQLKMVSD